MKKKIICALLTVALILTLVSCGGSGDAVDSGDVDVDTQGKILVVYFTAAENSGVDAVSSASVVTVDGEAKGVSQAVAEMIADETGADLFSIRTGTVYPANMGELIDYAAEEQDDNARPELTSHIENLDDYATVFVGFPIWWYDMSLFKRLYEDNVLGRIPDEQYRILSNEYTSEQEHIKNALPELTAHLQELKDSTSNFDRFLENARKYTEINELTPELLHTFIKRIEVGERAKKYSRSAPQDIVIHYRDIGIIDDMPQELSAPITQAPEMSKTA